MITEYRNQNKPKGLMKVGIFDLETSGFFADSSILLCCSVKPYDCYITGRKQKVTTLRADSYPTWKNNKTNEKKFIQDVLDVLDEYDILIAHNGEYFDKTYLNTKATGFDLEPIMRYKKTIDPCLAARKHLKLGRNSLAAIIDYLHIPVKKTPIELHIWTKAALEGDKKCMDKIVEHCEHDVVTLELVYDRMRKLIDKIDKRGSSY